MTFQSACDKLLTEFYDSWQVGLHEYEAIKLLERAYEIGLKYNQERAEIYLDFLEQQGFSSEDVYEYQKWKINFNDED